MASPTKNKRRNAAQLTADCKHLWCVNNLLPAGSFHSAPNHALEAGQVRDVAELMIDELVGPAQMFFANGQNILARSFLLPLPLSFFQDSQIGIGFLHGSNPSKNTGRRVTSEPQPC